MRRARVGQLFGLLPIPSLGFGVGSTPRMDEWVGGLDGAIWDDFSSWTCPFPAGDMDWPFSSWGYGPTRFQLGIWTAPVAVYNELSCLHPQRQETVEKQSNKRSSSAPLPHAKGQRTIADMLQPTNATLGASSTWGLNLGKS